MIKAYHHISLIILCLIWAGMIAGISFLEAPVKFTASSLTLPIGLDVGRHVFAVFNKVEIVFGLLLMIIVFTGKMSWNIKPWSLLVVVLLILECFWLLPVLDKRALAIIAGQTPEGQSLHTWYVVFDAVKLISLALIGYMGIKTISEFARKKDQPSF